MVKGEKMSSMGSDLTNRTSSPSARPIQRDMVKGEEMFQSSTAATSSTAYKGSDLINRKYKGSDLINRK